MSPRSELITRLLCHEHSVPYTLTPGGDLTLSWLDDGFLWVLRDSHVQLAETADGAMVQSMRFEL